MSVHEPVPEPWSAASAAELAQAAGAADLFVFRRVADSRFAHVGGAGRGTGWAGIVEVGEGDEGPIVSAMLAGRTFRAEQAEPWHVIGPYYAASVAAVPVSSDVFVVFGAPGRALGDLPDDELGELAKLASDALIEVAPAKRLADELEALNAVNELLHASAETFDDAMQRLVDQATSALSCDLGLAFVTDDRHAWVSDQRGGDVPLDRGPLADTLEAIGEWSTFPVCIQSADAAELPAPFRAADGVLAYYLLEIERPRRGFLLLLHTAAAPPRGFTLLCQSLGRKLVDASEPLLSAALLRDSMRTDLERAEAAARRDSLTGLANRLGWTEALASASACPDSPASVVQLDCRGLKQINDTYGHDAGDRLLRRVARILSECIRDVDLAARIGGDEFAVLLCGADEETADAIVERIETMLSRIVDFDGAGIGVSIGTATARDTDLDGAQRRADAKMLEAKRHGHRLEAAQPAV